MAKQMPHLETVNGRQYLMVDGKPMFLRAGELHNSSASSLSYMEENVWEAVRPLHLNALVLPVYWECVEPEEGQYDFSLVDGILARAREEGLKLVLLWFGLWKNGNSDYVPGWVKRDGRRFTRVLTRSGTQLNVYGHLYMTISPLCQAAVEADARCFARLMAHLAQVDGDMHTVVAVQVENEIGVLGSDRDYSPIANQAYGEPVPAALREGLGLTGMTWAECFGGEACESFMAWHYACAVQKIAAAGKAAWPLPMYCNAWLKQTPRLAGEYPSGGPQLHLQRIWRLAAPDIDFYAPDIYLSAYRDTCDQYCEAGNPLFIPEARQTADSAPYFFYALGEHGAMCFSPFGVEDMMKRVDKPDPGMLRLLDISEEAFRTGPLAGAVLAQAYALAEGMGELLTRAILEGRVRGFLDQGESGVNLMLRGCMLRVDYDKKPGSGEPLAGGMVVELGEDEFVVVGTSCQLHVAPSGEGGVEAERYEEGCFRDGVWQRRRILNGDERHNIRCGTIPQMFCIRVFPL